MRYDARMGIRTQLITILALVVVAGAITYIGNVSGGGGSRAACTMEAKLCPDGSAVGRTGPNCEFAPCPSEVPPTGDTSKIAIGSSATIHGTTIRVLELVEDSRCPVDVQCVWAGTVRVRTSIDSYNRDFTFTLGQPQVVGGGTVTLVSVIPAQKYSTQTVPLSDYRFTFAVVPATIIVDDRIPPHTSGVRGTVMLGPTCGAERMPPDPQCADKPYATTIAIYRSGSNSEFAVGKSDMNGIFEFSLPPGSYTLAAGNSMNFPRCASADAIVPTTGYITTTISCDTGIR